MATSRHGVEMLTPPTRVLIVLALAMGAWAPIVAVVLLAVSVVR